MKRIVIQSLCSSLALGLALLLAVAPAQAAKDINWADAVSFSVAGIDRVLSVKELLEKITSEAEAILKSWRFLKN